ncbi:MAG: crossover junction endodeoxyribonuclease RuvC [Chloroflexota bacterium]
MRVLGIDPGTIISGYGIVTETDDSMRLVDCGAIAFAAKTPIEQRLSQLYFQLMDVIHRHQPQEVAIEEPFVAQNVRSALAIGRAQAAGILAAGNSRLPVYFYAPAEVKKQVSGYGRSDKHQIQKTVQLHLGLDEPIESYDAADAVALAICHLGRCRLRRIEAQGANPKA